MSTAPNSAEPNSTEPNGTGRPGGRRGRRTLTGLAALAVTGLVLTACSGGQPAGFSDGSAPASASEEPAPDDPSEDTGRDSSVQGEAIVAEVDEPIDFPACEEAEQSGTATVTWLEDRVIEEQRHPGVPASSLTVDGQQVQVPAVPDIVVPERVGQAGCVIEFEAPGGCLPAVEISEAYIPGYRVPERTMGGVELPDGTALEEKVQAPLSAEAVRHEGATAEQACQVEPEAGRGGQVVASVVRPSIVRPSLVQPSAVAASLVRPATRTAEGDLVPAESVPAHSVQSLAVPAASVPAEALESYVVEGAAGTEYAERDDSVSYITEGDVLFDSDDHAVRADAEAELESIAEDIADRGGDRVIRVEGHTDDLATQAYADNEELSLRRAESVADWLVEHAGVDRSAVTAEGLGEDHPRAGNDSEQGRQQNRRVVITVTPRDHEPQTEVEVED